MTIYHFIIKTVYSSADSYIMPSGRPELVLDLAYRFQLFLKVLIFPNLSVDKMLMLVAL